MKPSLRTDAEGAGRLFWIVFFATAALKLVTASVAPITGDEAYFVTWGRNPALGFYDHGAMTGWLVAAMLQAGDAVLWLRFPAIVVTLLAALLMRGVLKPADPHLGNLAAILWLLSPANLFGSLITTDAPLMFFSVLGVVAAFRAGRVPGSAALWWLISGLCLGAALLSKYFAVLTGLALGLWLLFGGPRPRFGALVLMLAGSAPGVAVNVAWNHANGWANFLFNLGTRNSSVGFNPDGPVAFVLFLLFLLGPLVFVAAGVRPSRMRAQIAGAVDRWKGRGLAGIAIAGIVPVLVLGAVSLLRDVGIHWVLSFVPWLMISLAAAVSRERVERLMRPALIYAGVQAVLVAMLLALPVEQFRWHRSYAAIVLGAKTDEVASQLEPMRDGYTLAADSYGVASLLAYHNGAHVPVFGIGSHHGRQDDWVTDFRRFDGKDVMVVTGRKHRVERMPAWFTESEIREIEVRGARIYVCLGRGFRYDIYREAVLRPAAERYYPALAWLERISGPAPFVARYGLRED
jgi:hypothetical protein